MAEIKIKLPPINIGTAVVPSSAGLRLVADADTRARDLEVARMVLEAAAELVHTEYLDAFLFGTKEAATLQELERSIRTLEVSHD